MFLDKWVHSSEKDEAPDITNGRMVVHYKRHIDWFLAHRSPKGSILEVVAKYRQAAESLLEIPAEKLEHELAVQEVYKLLVVIGMLSLNDLNQLLLQKFPGVLLKSHSTLPKHAQKRLCLPFLRTLKTVLRAESKLDEHSLLYLVTVLTDNILQADAIGCLRLLIF